MYCYIICANKFKEGIYCTHFMKVVLFVMVGMRRAIEYQVVPTKIFYE